MNNNTAFTLVELAIVLIIIGLITGGVLGAQSLINSSKTSSIITDVTSYQQALDAFELEYDAIPGDMSDATDYWPTTCNGSGDGILHWIYNGCLENFAVFEHLSLAELIDGTFDRTNGTGSLQTNAIPAVSVPEKYEGGYSFQYWLPWSGAGDNYYRVVLRIGAKGGGTTYHLNEPMLHPKQVQKIDRKLDNGLPMSGWVGISDTGNGCHSSSTTYDLDDTEPTCVPAFILRK